MVFYARKKRERIKSNLEKQVLIYYVVYYTCNLRGSNI